jgi:hypothetical protein
MTFEAFVYVWTNTRNNMYYIGKHKGPEDDGYISSGKHFLAAYYSDPKAFEREIVFRGTDREALQEESKRIEEAIKSSGYERIYNLTTWGKLKTWKRTCLYCGAICCPDNEQWAAAFEEIHFTNCHKAPRSSVVLSPIRKSVDKTKSVEKSVTKPKPQTKEVKKQKRLVQKKLTRKQERINWWKEYDKRNKTIP